MTAKKPKILLFLLITAVFGFFSACNNKAVEIEPTESIKPYASQIKENTTANIPPVDNPSATQNEGRKKI